MQEQCHKLARASFFLHLSLYRNIKNGSALHFWAKLKKMDNFWHVHHKAGSLHSLLAWSHSLIWKSIYSSAQYWKKTNFHICRTIVSYSEVHISCLSRLSLIPKLNIIEEKGKGERGRKGVLVRASPNAQIQSWLLFDLFAPQFCSVGYPN